MSGKHSKIKGCGSTDSTNALTAYEYNEEEEEETGEVVGEVGAGLNHYQNAELEVSTQSSIKAQEEEDEEDETITSIADENVSTTRANSSYPRTLIESSGRHEEMKPNSRVAPDDLAPVHGFLDHVMNMTQTERRAAAPPSQNTPLPTAVQLSPVMLPRNRGIRWNQQGNTPTTSGEYTDTANAPVETDDSPIAGAVAETADRPSIVATIAAAADSSGVYNIILENTAEPPPPPPGYASSSADDDAGVASPAAAYLPTYEECIQQPNHVPQITAAAGQGEGEGEGQSGVEGQGQGQGGGQGDDDNNKVPPYKPPAYRPSVRSCFQAPCLSYSSDTYTQFSQTPLQPVCQTSTPFYNTTPAGAASGGGGGPAIVVRPFNRNFHDGDMFRLDVNLDDDDGDDDNGGEEAARRRLRARRLRRQQAAAATKDYQLLAFLACVLWWPLGLVALYYSYMTRLHKAHGNPGLAASYSKSAFVCAVCAILFGFVSLSSWYMYNKNSFF